MSDYQIVDDKYAEPILNSSGEILGFVDARKINTELTSLHLLGSQVNDLASIHNNNMLQIMQSFAGVYPPLNPIEGQQWFNTSNKKRYIYTDLNWYEMDIDPNYNIYMYNKFDIDFSVQDYIVIESLNIPLEISNTFVFNYDTMDPVIFSIDTYNKKKIIFKQNVENVIIVVFNPKDKIANNKINISKKIITTSSETQFDISDILNSMNINAYTVILNDIVLTRNDFKVVNNILNIRSNLIVNPNDEIEIKKYGSCMQYKTKIIIESLSRTDRIKIPKMFKEILSYNIYDLDNSANISSIDILNDDESIELFFIDAKKIKVDLNVRII